MFWERTSGGRDFYQELRRKCEARDPSFAKPQKVKAGKPATTESEVARVDQSIRIIKL